MSTAELALRNDAVSWTPTDSGTVVVLDLRTSRYLSLNASGSVLWTLLADGTTEPALRTSLVDAFGLDEDAAARDVDTFVSALRARDLLAE